MSMVWDPSKPADISAGGARLECRCFGPSPDQGTTIVMLHEGLGSVRLWRDFPERISTATGCGVFAYSRRGYGGSDQVQLPRPLDYMMREAVEVLPDVLAAIGLRRGILLGHSDGASIATLYAGTVQDHRIRGVILVAPHFFTEPVGLQAIAQSRIAYEMGDLAGRLAKYHRDVEGAFRGWNDAWLDPGFIEWNIEDAIDYLRVPVLAIQGRDDGYGTLAQIEALRSRLYSPLDTLILDDCGHSPFIDHPDETLHAVQEFAARLEKIETTVVAVG